jgi:hypothetical protein
MLSQVAMVMKWKYLAWRAFPHRMSQTTNVGKKLSLALLLAQFLNRQLNAPRLKIGPCQKKSSRHSWRHIRL